jgi:hypothetical protein
MAPFVDKRAETPLIVGAEDFPGPSSADGAMLGVGETTGVGAGVSATVGARVSGTGGRVGR